MAKGSTRISMLKPAIGMLKTGPTPLAQVTPATVDPTSWRSGLSSTKRGYGYKWQQARDGFLKKHPICVMCEQEGKITAATTVDHKVAHRGDMVLFWDSTNWQSLCTPHHSSHAQRRDNEAAR
jgi:5-methylcytosine-specific restriction protein A